MIQDHDLELFHCSLPNQISPFTTALPTPPALTGILLFLPASYHTDTSICLNPASWPFLTASHDYCVSTNCSILKSISIFCPKTFLSGWSVITICVLGNVCSHPVSKRNGPVYFIRIAYFMCLSSCRNFCTIFNDSPWFNSDNFLLNILGVEYFKSIISQQLMQDIKNLI